MARRHPGEWCHLCDQETPERVDWPSCRDCLEPTCDRCMVPKSLQEHEWDKETETGTFAVLTIDVQCRYCALQDHLGDVYGEPVEDPDCYSFEHDVVR